MQLALAWVLRALTRVPVLGILLLASEYAVVGDVLSWFFPIELSNKILYGQIKDELFACDSKAEVTGRCLDEHSESLLLEPYCQLFKGIPGSFSFACLGQVLPVDDKVLRWCMAEGLGYLVDDLLGVGAEFLEILGLSKNLHIGVLPLAIGVEAVDVGVGEGIEGVDCAQVVEVGAVDDGLAASEVIFDEIPAVAPEVVDGVDWVWEGACCEREC